MKITVIGHLCLDVIQHADGTETQSYGGIFFTVTTLANLLGANDSVAPVFGVGKSDYDALIERLRRYGNIDVSGIYKFAGPTNQVSLKYADTAARAECSRYIAEPIPIRKIRQHIDCDCILINMISGFDITLETLDEIRMEVRESQIPVYLDIHSLTLGISKDFVRFHRPVETWRRWTFMIHAAQMNEEEAAVISLEHFDERSLAQHVLALNTKALIITRGERGCTAFVDIHKHIQRHDIAGTPARGSSIDPTGCGDVFGAAYCAHYIKTKDITGSLQFANSVAACKADFPGSMEIDKIASFRIEEVQEEHKK